MTPAKVGAAIAADAAVAARAVKTADRAMASPVPRAARSTAAAKAVAKATKMVTRSASAVGAADADATAVARVAKAATVAIPAPKARRAAARSDPPIPSSSQGARFSGRLFCGRIDLM